MKFAAIALIATVSAQTKQVKCTDGSAFVVCVEKRACCGYITYAYGAVTRACGDGTGAAAVEYEGDGVFSCEAAAMEEEGATKLALGLSAVVAALYMA